jgi:hypothetical protein
MVKWRDKDLKEDTEIRRRGDTKIERYRKEIEK